MSKVTFSINSNSGIESAVIQCNTKDLSDLIALDYIKKAFDRDEFSDGFKLKISNDKESVNLTGKEESVNYIDGLKNKIMENDKNNEPFKVSLTDKIILGSSLYAVGTIGTNLANGEGLIATINSGLSSGLGQIGEALSSIQGSMGPMLDTIGTSVINLSTSIADPASLVYLASYLTVTASVVAGIVSLTNKISSLAEEKRNRGNESYGDNQSDQKEKTSTPESPSIIDSPEPLLGSVIPDVKDKHGNSLGNDQSDEVHKTSQDTTVLPQEAGVESKKSSLSIGKSNLPEVRKNYSRNEHDEYIKSMSEISDY